MGTHLLLLTAVLLSSCQVTESQALGVEAAENVWSERPVDPGSDLESIASSNNEPDVEYTEVVHPQSEDSVRGPPYDHHDYGSVEYADLNSDPPDVHCAPLVQDLDDLPVPVE